MPYIGNSPGLGQEVRFRYLSTANQSVFTGFDATGLILNYVPGLERVYVAGRRMARGVDYTATDGTTITLAQGISAGVWVLVDALATFNPANTYTQAQVDALFTPGMIVGRAYAETNANTSITAAINPGASAISSSAGVQILTASITPKSVSNLLRVRTTVPVQFPTGASTFCIAACINAEATARRSVFSQSAGYNGLLQMEFDFAPAATTAQTISIRAGVQTGATAVLNQSPSNGGTVFSTLVIEELKG